MDARMQRLHAPVHHLRHAGDGADVGDGEAGFGQRAGGAAGREDLDAVLGQRAGEVDDPGLVGDGDQRALDLEKLGAGGFETDIERTLRSSVDRRDCVAADARRQSDQTISVSRHFTGTSERALLVSTIWLRRAAAENVGEVHALLELDRAVRLEAPDAAVGQAEVERGAPVGRMHGDGVVQVEAHGELRGPPRAASPVKRSMPSSSRPSVASRKLRSCTRPKRRT